MTARTLICFPCEEAPGLRAEAAHFALGLAARGVEVIALGSLGPWRHPLRLARVTATDLPLSGNERKFTRLVHEYDPGVIHAFGAEMAHHALPLTLLVGAGGVVTLGHRDLSRLNPGSFRTASAVFVPCEYLREQVARRLPSAPVVSTGYLLPPPESLAETKHRFLAEELGLADGAPLVLLADHFHGSDTDVALALLEACPLLAERIPGLQVILAGDGLRLGELEQQAIEVNSRLGYRAVLTPGHRDDIARLLALTTVAVGSGRFAMEAVGAGVALVGAGAAGMLGTFTPKSAAIARFTCCGRHGHLEPLAPKALASEIIGLFAYPQYRERFGAEGQALVMRDYERGARAEEITAYYGRSTALGAAAHMPQHIAVIMPDDLREALFALPAIAGLRGHFPLAEMQVVAAHGQHALLRLLPLTERLLARPSRAADWPRFLRAFCVPRADVCLAFSRRPSAALFAACSLASHRVGGTGGAADLVFTDHQPARGPVSPARALALAQTLGVSEAAPIPPPALPADATDAANAALAAAGLRRDEAFILLCPQVEEARAWDPLYWDALVQRLCAERPESIVALADGAPAPAGAVPVNAGEDLAVLAALLARAAVVIAPDNGPLHLADLLGVPTIGLYGPTSPEVCALPNANARRLCHREYPCHPCMDTPCPERRCLRALSPDEVADEAALALPALTGAAGRPPGE